MSKNLTWKSLWLTAHTLQTIGRRWLIVLCALLIIPLAHAAQPYVIGWDASQNPQQLTQIMSQVLPTPLRRYPLNFTTYAEPINYSNQITPSRLDFTKAIFQQNVTFLLATVPYSLSFRAADFLKPADLSNVHFQEIVNFNWATFEASSVFSHSTFEKQVFFFESAFKGPAEFYDTDFRRGVLFNGTHFISSANFSTSLFKHAAQFQRTNFADVANFESANFTDKADFTYTNFQGPANFSKTTFSKKADFSHAQFNDAVLFSGATLPFTLDFSGITAIHSVIDFTNTHPPTSTSTCQINLVGTDLSHIKLRYESFHLYFPKDTNEKDIAAVYEGLLNSLQKNGFMDNYQRLSIEYQQYLYLKHNQWFINAVQKNWWNYGFAKERIFIWIGTLILLITFVNSIFYDWLMKNAYEVPFLAKAQTDPQAEENPIVRYIFNFPFALIYTLMLFFGGLLGFRRDEDRFRSHNIFINLYLTFVIASGLLCTMFVLHYLIGR